jgi:hypothetical protein
MPTTVVFRRALRREPVTRVAQNVVRRMCRAGRKPHGRRIFLVNHSQAARTEPAGHGRCDSERGHETRQKLSSSLLRTRHPAPGGIRSTLFAVRRRFARVSRASVASCPGRCLRGISSRGEIRRISEERIDIEVIQVSGRGLTIAFERPASDSLIPPT